MKASTKFVCTAVIFGLALLFFLIPSIGIVPCVILMVIMIVIYTAVTHKSASRNHLDATTIPSAGRHHLHEVNAQQNHVTSMTVVMPPNGVSTRTAEYLPAPVPTMIIDMPSSIVPTMIVDLPPICVPSVAADLPPSYATVTAASPPSDNLLPPSYSTVMSNIQYQDMGANTLHNHTNGNCIRPVSNDARDVGTEDRPVFRLGDNSPPVTVAGVHTVRTNS